MCTVPRLICKMWCQRKIKTCPIFCLLNVIKARENTNGHQSKKIIIYICVCIVYIVYMKIYLYANIYTTLWRFFRTGIWLRVRFRQSPLTSVNTDTEASGRFSTATSIISESSVFTSKSVTSYRPVCFLQESLPRCWMNLFYNRFLVLISRDNN